MWLLRQGRVPLLQDVLPGRQANLFAICNPNTRAGCYAKHVAGHMPIHKINIGIKKKAATHTSPRQAERAQAYAPALVVPTLVAPPGTSRHSC